VPSRAGDSWHPSDDGLLSVVRTPRRRRRSYVIFTWPAWLLARLFVGIQTVVWLPTAAAGFGDWLYRADRRSRLRPRSEYLLGSLGFGLLTIVLPAAAGLSDEHHVGWLVPILAVASIWSFVYTFALFARSVFRGALRRAFWAHPPWWAFEGAPREWPAPGAPVAMPPPSITAARSRPASAVVDHSVGAAFIRERPVRLASAGDHRHHKPPGSGLYEIICIACGDNPDLDYSAVPADIQRVRGPYPTVDFARDVLRQHLKLLSNR
jgi:MFS family permease